MKASFYKIDPAEQESFRCVRVRKRDFGTPWHFHPEYQVTLVVRSHGHRLVGDDISAFAPGDLTLIGPNLPHFWHHDRPGAAGRIEALMIHFDPAFMGGAFLQRPELPAVAGLLEQSARGLQFPAGIRRRRAADEVERVFRLSGLPRLLGLLSLLEMLAGAGGRPMCGPAFSPRLDRSDQERMERVWPASPSRATARR
jgi:hypothetical protein